MKQTEDNEIRLVKAWESEADMTKAKTSMALAPQGTFWISAKVGDIIPELQDLFPPEKFADQVAESIIKSGWDKLPFQAAADKLEDKFAKTPEDMRQYVEQIQVVLTQNRVEAHEEAETQTSKPASTVSKPALVKT